MRPLVLYLHGFASHTNSKKAIFFQKQFQQQDSTIEMRVLDLNQGEEGFRQLTLQRQIKQVESHLRDNKDRPIWLIGSSFGGLTATWVAHRNPSIISKMVLMAPAYQFYQRWTQDILKPSDLSDWKKQGELSLDHYGYKKKLKLHYQFLQDLKSYPEQTITLACPTLTFLGLQDQTIPSNTIRAFSQKQQGMMLIELNDQHSLSNSLEQIWKKSWYFLSTHSSKDL